MTDNLGALFGRLLALDHAALKDALGKLSRPAVLSDHPPLHDRDVQ
ncbi:hypothetical protein [Streptomyces roseochromogenus]|uniref:Uncharacterized protein n=1 Tax=Streptomyces roseochromogenus subsp. oscitans DS 12.976 TaxID=1352936 RepID=V6JVJ6_STRRC|nr:hypothetical protein [Streptomyces roseochromogenus]EST23703.1 hypothetical protein M878_32865 [Streptomyces roseochromogenus subsp. oscitans DS 12.976]